MLNPISDVDKIPLASIHLEGKTEYWYMDNMERREFIVWIIFSKMGNKGATKSF